MPQGRRRKPSSRARRWEPEVRAALRYYWPTLDPGWIIAQIDVESAGNATAVSPVGAVGLMQIMPATTRDLSFTLAEIRNDPSKNIMGGVQYLARQFQRMNEPPVFTSRLALALACYNGGRGYVNKAIYSAKRAGIIEWWSWEACRAFLRGARVRGRVPDHAQMIDYVHRIFERFVPLDD